MHSQNRPESRLLAWIAMEQEKTLERRLEPRKKVMGDGEP